MLEMRRFTLLILLAFLPLMAGAQSWRYVRHEVSFGVGVSNFLGDLGGARGIGTHYFKDLKARSTRPTLQAGYKYTISPSWSAKTSLIWGYLHGDDAVTKNAVRNNRNLSFRSMIGEWNILGEFYPWGERVTHRYKIRGINGYRSFTIMPYLFTGIGMTLFNPKAQYNGAWVALQPLNTEGQGLAARPDPYKRVTVNFPFGVGAKYLITSQWSLSFELSVKYTLSDYIDDVSTTYYPADQLLANYGQASADLSNRALIQNGDVGTLTYPNGLTDYKQRGNPNYNDAYMFAIFSVHYRFTQGQNYIPKF